MSGMHPPASLRCQIYFTVAPESPELGRCENQGTHWEKWPGCGCVPCDPDVCEGDFFSWECDGEHEVPVSVQSSVTADFKAVA